MHIYGDYRQCTWNVIKRFVPLDYKEDQPRGISRSLPRRKTGLASNTKKSYIKSKSHCLIFYQSIVGGLYTIISEGKFTQSFFLFFIDIFSLQPYNNDRDRISVIENIVRPPLAAYK